ncbi:hypothetical protein [Microvirga sp. VF16]|uniref:hypothetical protein n=1 Tax=Microvirga sp. VF16 TaxID=2807101 RepID=UPI00193DABB6|nr:hypothetical protein [Microvirga sp. VF16]QRM31396.1 hypothetical protein JO965_10645 [Microvirga sp. VF16]
MSDRPLYEGANNDGCLPLRAVVRRIDHVDNDHERRLGSGQHRPRDGTPVILWTVEDNVPPVLPLTVGFWTISHEARVGYWRIFADHPRICSDRQIRGWTPLLSSYDNHAN